MLNKKRLNRPIGLVMALTFFLSCLFTQNARADHYTDWDDTEDYHSSDFSTTPERGYDEDWSTYAQAFFWWNQFSEEHYTLPVDSILISKIHIYAKFTGLWFNARVYLWDYDLGDWSEIYSHKALGTYYCDVEVDAGNFVSSGQPLKVRVAGQDTKYYESKVRFYVSEGSPAPGAFNLSGPSNGATNISTRPTLSWGASSGAASYDVYYGTTSPGTLQTNVITTSYPIPSGLEYSTTYYWKIVARNANGETTATGSPWSFTTGAAVPVSTVSSVFYYDNLGRQTKIEKTIEGTTYRTQTEYDDMGRVTEVTYPDDAATEVRYSFNPNNGAVSKAGSPADDDKYLKSLDYNLYGQVTQKTLGNDVEMSYAYDPYNLRLEQMEALNGLDYVQKLEYAYNDVGMVTQIYQSGSGENYFNYYYDDLYRLTRAERQRRVGADWTTTEREYEYDKIGNITRFNNNGSGDQYYTYDAGDKPHAVRTYGGNTYAYDANGNMLSGAGRTFTWNYSNMPTRIVKDGTPTEFYYGPNSERVKKQSGSDYKIYMGKIYEKDQSGKEICYISAGGSRVKQTDEGELYFFIPDHLGGMSVITDKDGNMHARQYYYPYGEDDPGDMIEPATDRDDHKFTDQEKDNETGLYNYNARLYDPALRRFISPDPLVGPNRYMYCLNNPVNAIDPSGYETEVTMDGLNFSVRWSDSVDISWQDVLLTTLLRGHPITLACAKHVTNNWLNESSIWQTDEVKKEYIYGDKEGDHTSITFSIRDIEVTGSAEAGIGTETGIYFNADFEANSMLSIDIKHHVVVFSEFENGFVNVDGNLQINAPKAGGAIAIKVSEKTVDGKAQLSASVFEVAGEEFLTYNFDNGNKITTGAGATVNLITVGGGVEYENGKKTIKKPGFGWVYADGEWHGVTLTWNGDEYAIVGETQKCMDAQSTDGIERRLNGKVMPSNWKPSEDFVEIK